MPGAVTPTRSVRRCSPTVETGAVPLASTCVRDGGSLPRMFRDASATARREWDAARITALRRSRGSSQASFATAIGVRRETVASWEAGRQKPGESSVAMLNLLAMYTDYRNS